MAMRRRMRGRSANAAYSEDMVESPEKPGRRSSRAPASRRGSSVAPSERSDASEGEATPVRRRAPPRPETVEEETEEEEEEESDVDGMLGTDDE